MNIKPVKTQRFARITSLFSVLVVGLTVGVGCGNTATVTSDSPNDSSATGDVDTPTVTVTRVIDGDTLETASGEKVRLIGIDTPEQGECGYTEAGVLLAGLVENQQVVLLGGAREDVDRYGRLLRYVEVSGMDVNAEMIRSGRAIARYDSRDGYGAHPRETAYVNLDESSPSTNICDGQQPETEKAGQTSAGELDERYSSCSKAIANGLGPYTQGVDLEYDWYQDGDSDGVVCER